MAGGDEKFTGPRDAGAEDDDRAACHRSIGRQAHQTSSAKRSAAFTYNIWGAVRRPKRRINFSWPRLISPWTFTHDSRSRNFNFPSGTS